MGVRGRNAQFGEVSAAPRVDAVAIDAALGHDIAKVHADT
jgi:hypothetical protein